MSKIAGINDGSNSRAVASSLSENRFVYTLDGLFQKVSSGPNTGGTSIDDLLKAPVWNHEIKQAFL